LSVALIAGRHYIKLGYTNSALGTSLSTSSDVKKWFVDGKKEHGEHTARLIATLFKGKYNTTNV